MKRGYFLFLITLMTLAAILIYYPAYVASSSNQDIYEQAFNPQAVSTAYPYFVVEVLKYEPYPVNAGDWFDLWVKVQNIGQENSRNTIFKLNPEYPFSSNDSLTRYYGLIYGTINAYKIDATNDSTQVILKYRVKAADNAPSGTSNLKLSVTSDNFTSGLTYDLPIDIFTKTNEQPLPVVQPAEPAYLKWVYGLIGLITGVFMVILLKLLRKRVKK